MGNEGGGERRAASALPSIVLFFLSAVFFSWAHFLRGSGGSDPAALRPFDLSAAGVEGEAVLPMLEGCARRWEGTARGAVCRAVDGRKLAEFASRAVRREWNPFGVLERHGRVLEFLGIVPPGFDYPARLSRLYARGVSGFFYPHTGEIVLASGSPFPERVLAHEFEHFLQYRNSPIETARFDAFLALDFDRYTALRALEEGDAEEAERAALSKLAPPFLSRRRRAERRAGGEEGDSGPPLLAKLESWPYEAGAEWARKVRNKGEWFRRCRELRVIDLLACRLPPRRGLRGPFTFEPPSEKVQARCGPVLLALFLEGAGVRGVGVREAAALLLDDWLTLSSRGGWWRLEMRDAASAERLGRSIAAALGAGGDFDGGPFDGKDGWRLVSWRGNVLLLTGRCDSPEALGETMRAMEEER